MDYVCLKIEFEAYIIHFFQNEAKIEKSEWFKFFQLFFQKLDQISGFQLILFSTSIRKCVFEISRFKDFWPVFSKKLPIFLQYFQKSIKYTSFCDFYGLVRGST